jgi:hypothetical protein
VIKNFFVISIFMIMFFAQASAKPISLFGLNLGMADLKTEVEKKGYNCKTGKDIWGTILTTCINDSKEIKIFDDKIVFNCHVFNGCGFSLKEVAQNVANQGVVSNDLEHSRKNIGGSNSGIVREDYCARGTDGDILCVVGVTMFGTDLSIEILKGTLGRGGMSFD